MPTDERLRDGVGNAPSPRPSPGGRGRKYIALFAALALAGCAKHAEKDVATYRDVLDRGARPAPVEVGPSLSLGEAFALANANNESLAVEGEALVRAITDKRRAVAAFLPTVDARPAYNIREKTSAGGGIVIGDGTGGTGGGTVVGGDSGSGGSGGYDADLNIPITATWVVFDGLRNVNAYWRDVYLVERQRERLLEAQESLLFDVAQVYYTVLRAEEQIRVLEQSLQVQGERLRDVRGRQSAGVARPLDIAQTEAQYAGTRVTLIEARRQLADARSLLAYLINAPAVEALPLDDGFATDADIAPADALVAIAARNRSELRAAERSIAAAERDVRVAIGQYYPSLTIDFSVFLYRESVPTERTWESLLQVNFPIFSGGRIDADVRTAWSFLREAQLISNQSQRRVRREVEQGLRDLASSDERLAELGVQLNAATEAARQAEAVYRAGRGTNLDRVAAQDVQLQAGLALATEAYDQKLLRLNLLRVTGTLRETLLNVPTATTAPVTP